MIKLSCAEQREWGGMAGKTRREFDVENHPYPGLVLYEVTLDDLDALEKETLSVGEDFSFALFGIATALSFTVTLSTVQIPAGKVFDVFWIIMALGYIVAIYFGIRWAKGRRNFKSIVKRIKERSGSLGEEGQEIDSAELESLAEETTGQ